MSPDFYCPDCDIFDYESHAFLACVVRERGRVEAETVARIVAWLRAEADARASRGCMAGADDLAGFADAIEQGEWKTGGGCDG